jgi:hypothetical protein
VTTYRLWPATNGPATANAYSGNFLSGTCFFVTGEAWFQGYWWWLSSSGGQNTGPTKCALWQVDANGTTHLVAGSVVTSGNLVAGWNYIPVTTAFQLSYGGSVNTAHQSAVAGVAQAAQYIAAIAVNGPFPDTTNYWGAGQPGAGGITNGPLTAYSAIGGGMQSPYPGTGTPQGVFTTGSGDPSVMCPTGSSGTDNFWVDVQVSDYSGAPSGASVRLWPSFPLPDVGANADTTLAVSGTAFTLSEACTLNKIWMFSPPGATGLPSRVGIFNSDTKAEIAAAGNSSPSWSGAAGSGWVSVSYTGVTLPAGNYMVAFFNGSGLSIYMDSHNHFFSGTDPVGGAAVGGAGWNGLSAGAGILTAPNVANGPLLVYDDSSGTKHGQTAYQPGNTTWQYPSEFEASADWGETRWIDVEVTPIPPAAVAAGGAGGDENRQTALKKMDWLLLYLYVCVHGPSTSVRLIWVCGMSLRRQQPRGAASRSHRCWPR